MSSPVLPPSVRPLGPRAWVVPALAASVSLLVVASFVGLAMVGKQPAGSQAPPGGLGQEGSQGGPSLLEEPLPGEEQGPLPPRGPGLPGPGAGNGGSPGGNSGDEGRPDPEPDPGEEGEEGEREDPESPEEGPLGPVEDLLPEEDDLPDELEEVPLETDNLQPDDDCYLRVPLAPLNHCLVDEEPQAGPVGPFPL